MKRSILFLITFLFIFDVYASSVIYPMANSSDSKESAKEKINKKSVELTNSLESVYILYNNTCGSDEKIAIIEYADGDIDKLSGGFTTIRGLTTSSGKELSDKCANYADDLYKVIKEIQSFVSSNQLYLIIFNLECNMEIKKNQFVNGSKIVDREDITIVDECDLIDKDFKKAINSFLGYVQIGIVCLTVVLCIVDLYKLFVSKDLDSKKVFKNIRNRVIVLIIILLLPIITNIIISIINRYVKVSALKCLES